MKGAVARLSLVQDADGDARHARSFANSDLEA
jgi:hypothetical protein